MPKYFTSSGWSRYVLFSCTGGHEDRLGVKVTWADFVSLAFIRHFLSHFCMSSRAVCSLCVAISGLAWTARTKVKVAVRCQLWRVNLLCREVREADRECIQLDDVQKFINKG
jgi:hypothetical protein